MKSVIRYSISSGIFIGLIFLTGFLLSSCSRRYDTIEVGEIHRIHSAALDESRLLYIYTPKDYEFRKSTYPVVYLLDGKNHFKHISGIVDFLSNSVQIPKMIVVGIQSIDQDIDFGTEPTGYSKRFKKFISEEVTGYIEQNYRTDPFRILVGHSMGGLCVLNTILSPGACFNAYLSISPWLEHDNRSLLNQIDSLLENTSHGNSHLFLAYAESEYYLKEAAELLIKKLKTKAPAELNWSAHLLNYECHETTFHPGVYYGIKSLYTNWRFPHRLMNSTLEEINSHFSLVSEELGYTLLPPEDILNIVGYRNLDLGNFEEAIKIFDYNVELNPYSANVYDSRGEAYETDGQYEPALDSYNSAYERAMRMDDPDIEIYKSHITRIRGKIRDQKTNP